MANSVQRLRKEFEKLSALAALDVYPDYPVPDTESTHEKAYDDDSDQLDEVQKYEEYDKYNKHYHTMSYPIITKKGKANTNKSDSTQTTNKSDSIQTTNKSDSTQTTNKVNQDESVYYSQFDDMDDILSFEKDEDVEKGEDVEKYKSQLEDLNNKLSKKTAFAEHLQEQINAYRNKEDDEEREMRNTLSELEDHIKESKQSKNELAQHNASLHIRIENLQKELNNKDYKIEELQQDNHKNSEVHTRRQSEYHLQLQKADADSKSYQHENGLLLKESDKLNVEVSALRKYSRDLEQELNDVSRQLRSSQTDLLSYKNIEQESTIARQSVVSQLSLFKTQNESLQNEIVDKNLNINKLTKTNESLSRKSRTNLLLLKQTQNKHQSYEKDFADLYGILTNLKNNLDKMPQINTASVSLDIRNGSQSEDKSLTSKDFVEDEANSTSIEKEIMIHEKENDQNLIRSEIYNKSIHILNNVVLFLNQNRKLKKELVSIKTKSWNKKETFHILEDHFRKYQHLMDDKLAMLSKENAESQANMKEYYEFIQNLSNNFSSYHELMENKFLMMNQNISNGKNEVEQYRDTIDRMQREYAQLEESNAMEMEQFHGEINRLKDVQKEYEHLCIEHKHLQSRFEAMSRENTQKSRSKTCTHTLSIDRSKSEENAERLKDQVYDLRKTITKLESKWDELRQTPAKYYIRDIDQKHQFSTDEYRNYWGMGLDNLSAKWRQKPSLKYN